MNGKPMLSVERELLAKLIEEGRISEISDAEWKELRALLDKEVLESQYDGMTQGQAQDVSDGVDEILHDKPAAQHQGEPVAWAECSPAWLKAGGDCATAPRICVGREGISHLHPVNSNAEQPAPAAVVMPPEIDREYFNDESMAAGWNECLEEVARLNGVKP